MWVHRMDPAGSPPIVIMPDATIDLQWIGGSLRIAGPDKEPQTEVLAADEVVIGLRFHPAAAAAWLGVPQIELVGKRLSLDDLWGARARRLASCVRASDNLEDLACSLQQVLAEEVGSRAPDVPMQAAYRLIERGPPPDAPLVPWLMRALEMSEGHCAGASTRASAMAPRRLTVSSATSAFCGFRATPTAPPPCWLPRRAIPIRRILSERAAV